MGTPEFQRARDLMAKYKDLPMDFADASLVAVAEVLDEARVFTLDADFRIYRFRDRGTFDVLP
jgi:predicted nucleic acid-binding protein